MKFSAIIFLLLPFVELGISKPTPLSITTVKIITTYVVVPFPEPFPMNLLIDARSFLGLQDRSLICKIDAVLLACKAVAAKASPFCSSYLHLASSTTVVVVTPSTTTTQTVTQTVDPPPTDTLKKRGAKIPIPTPPGLGHFLAKELSSACSCLSIPVAVVTTTSTAPTMTITSMTTTTSTITLSSSSTVT